MKTNRDKATYDDLVKVLSLAVELSERNDNNGSESKYMRHIAKQALNKAMGG